MIVANAIGNRKQKLKRTPTERAYYRREQSENISDVLKSVAESAKDDVALALAERMRLCSLKSNHYLADDLVDSNGECFAGFGNLWGCGSKLCHSCLSRSGNRNRKLAREAVENTKLKRREYFCYVKQKTVVEQEQLRFITLTMPKVGLSCVQTLDLLKRAWELFRKLDFTKNYCSGFVKSAEFTVRDDKTYHAHLHLLAVSFFIPEQLIKKYWLNCVRKAFAEKELKFKQNAVVVNLKKVDSIENALLEVCKYITKSESWSQVPESHLLEIANVKRFPRMFEMTGCLKKVARRIKEQKELEKLAVSEVQVSENTEQNYLDKNDINDGKPSQILGINADEKRVNWRDRVREIGLEKYRIELSLQVSDAMRFRREILTKKYPLATFSDLAGFVWHDPSLDFVDEISSEDRVSWETSVELLANNRNYYQTQRFM